MKPVTYRIKYVDDLKKAFSYAKRLLENAKFGVIIQISEKKLKRSNKQNRYYRGYLVKTIAERSGYSQHEFYKVHEALKDMFCPEKPVAFDRKIKSTTLLNTAEEEEYHRAIRMWYYDYDNYMLALPNEIIEEEK